MTGRSSPWIAACSAFGLPLIVFCFVLYRSGASPIQIFEGTAVRIYYAGMVLALAGYAAASLREGRYAPALIGCGAALILIQGGMFYAGRFSATARIGVGEAFSAFETLDAGPWAGMQEVPVAVAAATEGPDASCTLRIDGTEQVVPAGGSARWNGLMFSCNGVHRAPLMLLLDGNGKELEGGYFAYRSGEGIPDHVQFRILPHRFYLSAPDAAVTTWRKTGGAWASTDTPPAPQEKREPGSLRLRIVRGKITLFDGILKPGKTVAFDGHQVLLSGEAPWVHLGIERKQGYPFLWAGILMLGAGTGLGAFSLRRQR